jgi:hypothetical protein
MSTGAPTEAGQAPEPAAPSRRRLPIVPILVLVAIVGGLVWLVQVRSSPAQQVRRLIDKQIKLANGGRFDQLWQDTLSVRVKNACPKDSFTGALDQLRSSRPEFWNLIEYRDLHIEVSGDRAVVTYVIVYNGAPVERATPANPDLYTRASQTVYGRTVSVQEQLQNLEHAHEGGAILGKEYEDERKAIPRRGPIRVRDSVKGQWYDDADGHVRCG